MLVRTWPEMGSRYDAPADAADARHGADRTSLDLWKALDVAQALHTVEWRWVRGHNGHPGNERADMLATRGVEVARAASKK